MKNETENFRKLIYKVPDFQDKEKKEYTKEQLEYSEKIAKDKLKKILDQKFNEFSIRYVNIEEYKKLLEFPKFQGEVILHGSLSRPFGDFDISSQNAPDTRSFNEFVKKLSKPETINEYTNWDSSVRLPKSANELLQIIKQTEKESKKLDKESRLEKLKEAILQFISKKEQGRNIFFGHGQRNLEVIKEFKTNPSFFEKSGSLRDIINAIIYSLDDPESSSFQGRQYEVGLIFDNKVFKFQPRMPMGYACWSSFQEKNLCNLSESEKKKGLLAAISIIPLKELYKEMIELEKGLGDFAHPIFDNSGNLRWPK